MKDEFTDLLLQDLQEKEQMRAFRKFDFDEYTDGGCIEATLQNNFHPQGLLLLYLLPLLLLILQKLCWKG